MTIIWNDLLVSVAEDSALGSVSQIPADGSRQLSASTASAARRPEARAPFSDGCSRWSPQA